MMSQARGYINSIIGMMNKMETPQRLYFMHYQVYQPAAEVEGQYSNDDRQKYPRIEPVNKTETSVKTPVRQFDDQHGQSRMNNEMDYGKNKIDTRVS